MSPHPRSCIEASRAWSQKIGVAKGSAADVALSRRLAGQAQHLCRSHSASQRAEGAQIYERALLACDGSSKDPAYQRY